MSNKKWRLLGAQFIRFNLVGLLNTAIDYVLFVALVWFGVNYLLAQTVAYGAGMVNSLLLNSRFTFRSAPGERRDSMEWKLVVRFIAWNGVVLGMTLLLLALLKEWLGIEEAVAKLLVTMVTVVINFYGSKRWVFQARQRG